MASGFNGASLEKINNIEKKTVKLVGYLPQFIKLSQMNHFSSFFYLEICFFIYFTIRL